MNNPKQQDYYAIRPRKTGGGEKGYWQDIDYSKNNYLYPNARISEKAASRYKNKYGIDVTRTWADQGYYDVNDLPWGDILDLDDRDFIIDAENENRFLYEYNKEIQKEKILTKVRENIVQSTNEKARVKNRVIVIE